MIEWVVPKETARQAAETLGLFKAAPASELAFHEYKSSGSMLLHAGPDDRLREQLAEVNTEIRGLLRLQEALASFLDLNHRDDRGFRDMPPEQSEAVVAVTRFLTESLKDSVDRLVELRADQNIRR